MTHRARPLFTVKQYESRHPWICIEYATADADMPNDLFGFDLKAGTSFDRALEIAQYLNDNLEEFSFTKLT